MQRLSVQEIDPAAYKTLFVLTLTSVMGPLLTLLASTFV